MSEEVKSKPVAAESRPHHGHAPHGGGHGSGHGPSGHGPRVGGGPGMKKRPMMHRRKCRICVEKGGYVDWKAINTLRNYITERGKVLSARSTGTCSTCQRKITMAVKRARNMALVPFAPHY